MKKTTDLDIIVVYSITDFEQYIIMCSVIVYRYICIIIIIIIIILKIVIIDKCKII